MVTSALLLHRNGWIKKLLLAHLLVHHYKKCVCETNTDVYSSQNSYGETLRLEMHVKEVQS